MQLRIVLIGLGLAPPCEDLVRALQRRRHQVTYLRQFAAASGDGEAPGRRASICYTSVESLFQLHTGTLRQADLIIVSSDVPYRAVLMSWVLDQACGVVAYCDVDPPHGAAARAPLPSFDFYMACASGHDAEHRAAALEQFVSNMAVPAL